MKNNLCVVHAEGAKATAPWLVIQPGIGCGAYTFESALPYLLPHYRVLLMNNPGVGGLALPALLSMNELVQNLEEAFAANQIKNAFLLGHSLGGFVAQEFTLKHPDKVKKLALISTSYGGTANKEAAQELTQFTVTGYAEKMMKRWSGAFNDTLFYGDAFKEKQPEKRAALHAMFMAHWPARAALWRQAWCGLSYSSMGRVQQIQAPVLVVHGTDDRIVHVEHGRALVQALPQARFWSLKQIGHFPMLEAENFWQRLQDFLAGDAVGEKLTFVPPPAEENWQAWAKDMFKNVFRKSAK